MKNTNWFEVSKKGLRELQAGKPKHFITRELVQNAWDEETKFCEINTSWEKGEASINIIDDSPDGFKDLSHAFTLFAPTYKRKNPEKRGRFNLGEKQVLSLCNYAKIQTTTGTIEFDEKTGRKQTSSKRKSGSEIVVNVAMSKYEFDEMMEMTEKFLVPKGITFVINGKEIKHRSPSTITVASLPTEIEENGIMQKKYRKTKIHVLNSDKDENVLYEMGIPVCEIDCQFDIDVQQKIPLSADREKVSQSYLKNLFAEVLNVTFDDIHEDDASESWVRSAFSSKKALPNAVRDIFSKRFGNKVVVANPFDKTSIDDAIASGYKVITGNELSKDEWSNVRDADAVKSSTEMFGKQYVSSKSINPTPDMQKIEALTKRIAKEVYGIDIVVRFAKWDGNTAAEYGSKMLVFNVKNLGEKFFTAPLSEEILDLIIHELGHEKGMHTEKAYHCAITKIASRLIILALTNNKFFNV